MKDEDRLASTVRSASVWAPAEGDEVRPPGPLAPAERYLNVTPHRAGGMGDVHRAWDGLLGCPVAIKLLAPELSGSPEHSRRFLAEARLTASLNHPSVVPVFDIGAWVDGRPFYAMRWAEGRRLIECITALHEASIVEQPPSWRPDAQGYSLRRLLELVALVCEAVAHAHRLGVVHRDLKPSNLVVTGPGQVMLLDWGLAWSPGLAAAGDDRMTCGTAGYAPPEQVAPQGAPDPRWDVYALGATLYELLCGSRPFGRGAALGRVLDGSPPPVSALTALPLDPGLVEIVAMAMAGPEQRHPDAGALGAALRGWLDGDARRARGLRVLEEADALLHELEKIRPAARAQQEAVRRMIQDTKPWAPEEVWRQVWAVEDEAGALVEALSEREQVNLERLREALTHDPELPEAHARIAALARGQHEEAELRRDTREAARWEREIRRHHRGTLDDYLAGEGRLDLETDPPGATVEAARYELMNRRLVEVPWGSLGQTPLRDVPLPMGSWMLTIRAPGRAPVRYPVWMRRLGRWPDVPPGEEAVSPVYLPREDELHPEDRYVPAGWFISGGDPYATRPQPEAPRYAEGFVLRQHPVTAVEYLEFLNDAAAKGALDPDWEPRDRSMASRGEALLRWDGRTYHLNPPLEPRHPVYHITWDGAAAFAGWRGARDGLPWQLPLADWMEKAARGVDGRFFPLGNELIGAWTWNRDSAAAVNGPRPVDAMGRDQSLYGVWGLAGNVRSWCADREEQEAQRAGGGTWTWPAGSCRAAGRMFHTPDTRIENLGLRLARPFPLRL